MIIGNILGHVLKIEGIFLLVPYAVSIAYGEPEGIAYLAMSLVCLLLGIIMTHKKPENVVFYLKEGCIATALSWIVMSIFGAIPFVMTGEIPHFVDAVFETVSGFTTTGASILTEVETLSHASLFWRSFTHWIGGMGVLVFLLAIIPLSGGSHINLMRAESPGPSVGKLVPKIKYTARILYMIYIGVTVLEMIMLLFGKMSLFESVCTALATAGTGGFGIKNDSIASYSPYIQWVVTVFMILFGVNFNFYYFVLFRHIKNALNMEEVKWYFVIVLAATTLIGINIYNGTMGVEGTARTAAFQVASIITTTGFATADFNLWPTFSKSILVLLMFVGACAGSTGGGIKVSRFIIAIKGMFNEMISYIHPKCVRKIKVDGKPVESEVVRSVNVYFITFFVIFVTSIVLVSIENQDVVTTFTAVAATINNIGPGLEVVGPTANFAHFGVFSKLVLIFDMLAGRLELFPLLILFQPTIWKK